ncbi:MAG: putrescine aminotransferase, partial [Armatimonadetes bacterium CG_4_9_14_3_um_filter_58_7]
MNIDADQYAEEIVDLYSQHLNPGLVALLKFMGFESVEVEAEGCVVRDAHGREYLDFLGGFGVFNFGHRPKKIIDAVSDQLHRMPMSSRVLFNEKTARLAAKLAEVCPGRLQYCFFCNSGTEATEGAIKIARLATGRQHIVATVGAFHGKTMGSLSASGREPYKAPFNPMVPGFSHVPFGDAKSLAETVNDSTAAVILEPIQGEGGVVLPPDDYLPAAREICDSHGALLIADEVQTGLGRTGEIFAVNHYGVAPDMMLLAKALGGGVMPLGAIVGTPDVWSVLESNPLLHSSTFGGNPLACAAGLAALEMLIEEDLARQAKEKGELLLDKLQSFQTDHPRMVVDVRGKGLMIGIEFTQEDIGGLVIAGLAQRGVIAAYTLNNPCVIRL